jgi:hypothetical protein
MGTYHCDMSAAETEKALAEMLKVDWRDGEQAEVRGVERLRRREEDRGRWRGRRGRNIFQSGREWISASTSQSASNNQDEAGRRRSFHVISEGQAWLASCRPINNRLIALQGAVGSSHSRKFAHSSIHPGTFCGGLLGLVVQGPVMFTTLLMIGTKLCCQWKVNRTSHAVSRAGLPTVSPCVDCKS